MRRLIVGIALVLACCSDVHGVRLQQATAIAEDGGLTPRLLDSGRYRILSYERPGPAGGVLTIYFEGDGRAWVNPWQPSTDPTPTDPIGLKLAAADPLRPLVYFARPCQFVGTEGCDNRLWTGARLSNEIVETYQRLIDAAMQRTGSTRLGLVGYSGGGALATLIAERRADVAWLVTVAADLDLTEWVRLKRLAPLPGSLNPAEYANRIDRLPQIHLTGSDDTVVPPAVAEAFLRLFPKSSAARLIVVPGFEHECCWADAWRRLIGALDIRR